jgi:hypothetical protein
MAGHGGVTSFYRQVMVEIEARRVALGLPQEKFGEWAGLPERYYAKALMADAPSGRQASWPMMQVMIDGLFPAGVDVILKPRPGRVIRADDLKAELLKLRERANPKTHREIMAEIGSKGGTARRKKISAKRARQISRKAAKARWRKYRETQKHVARQLAA